MSLCGNRKLRADRARNRWLIAIVSRCTTWADNGVGQSGNVVGKVLYRIGKYACLLFADLVNIFWQLGIQAMWGVCRLFARTKAKPDRIQHVFVLLLENRSFDHLMGFSLLQGIADLPGQLTTLDGQDQTSDCTLVPFR